MFVGMFLVWKCWQRCEIWLSEDEDILDECGLDWLGLLIGLDCLGVILVEILEVLVELVIRVGFVILE